MFSGIVEEYATLVALVKDQENIHFTFKCSFVNELKIDQSISHNGVCLTVVSLTDDTYTVTAMKETLERSNLGLLKVGDKVNQGDVICYVEAMKTYNAIRAEFSGTVTAICANSGDSVSEDDVLMKIG